jgi:hypothetical protein
MGISNFDGQGILAPEKTEIEAEVVGSITMKEQLWRIKQQREALKARYYFRAHMPLPICHHASAEFLRLLLAMRHLCYHWQDWKRAGRKVVVRFSHKKAIYGYVGCA